MAWQVLLHDTRNDTWTLVGEPLRSDKEMQATMRALRGHIRDAEALVVFGETVEDLMSTFASLRASPQAASEPVSYPWHEAPRPRAGERATNSSDQPYVFRGTLHFFTLHVWVSRMSEAHTGCRVCGTRAAERVVPLSAMATCPQCGSLLPSSSESERREQRTVVAPLCREER